MRFSFDFGKQIWNSRTFDDAGYVCCRWLKDARGLAPAEGVELKRTIFYIDDEAVCLNLFQKMFGDEYDVRTATTLAEARRMLTERPADIVISDQSMPEIKGTEFLSEVARTHPTSYRVLLTGSIHLGGVIPEIGSGLIQLFIPKPWTEHDMRRMLERAGSHFERGG